MTIDVAEEHRMIIDLVEKFVDNELMPLERAVMEREASGEPVSLIKEGAPVSEMQGVRPLGSRCAGTTRRRRIAHHCDAGYPGTSPAHGDAFHIST